ncbi:MAG: hypothetical protein HY901_31760, partial [Deltaproteobacteria bacterium]|nr:hypothetical protein [Deltaproteobacteria bacterium]
MNTHSRTRALLTLACAMVSCTPDLAPSPGALIQCASTAECPESWKCSETMKRCIRSDDSTAPSIVSELVIEPSHLRQGATAAVSFSVDEELSGPPEVKVRLGQIWAPLLQNPVASTKTTFVFTYTSVGPNSDEPQGVDCPLSVVLTDVAGNRTGNIATKALRFDFVEPSIVRPGAGKIDVAGSPAMGGATLTFRFTASEPLAAPPLVTMVGGAATAEMDPSSLGQEYVFTYSVGASDLEGAHAITVDLEDLAHNKTRLTAAGEAVLDFAAPTLLVGPFAAPSVARLNALVEVVFKASEPLQADAQVTLGEPGEPGEIHLELSPQSDPPTYRFTHLAAADDVGEKKVHLWARDLAGNPLIYEETPQAPFPTVLFDFVPPELLDPVLVPDSVRGGEDFHFQLRASEPLASILVEFTDFGGDPIAMTLESGPTPDLSYDFKGTTPVSGSTPFYAIRATLEDLAGNKRFWSDLTVAVDNTAPGIANFQVTPSVAKLGDQVRAVLTATEPTQKPPAVIYADGPATLELNLQEPTTGGLISYTYWASISSSTAAPSGTYAFRAFSLSDVAGNSGPVTPAAGFQVDSIVPALSNLTVTPDR